MKFRDGEEAGADRLDAGLRVLHYTLSGGTGGTVTGRCTYPSRAGDWGPSNRGAPLKEMPLTTGGAGDDPRMSGC
ncbi:unnamed protein product [Gadus morhua 'NCC']